MNASRLMLPALLVLASALPAFAQDTPVEHYFPSPWITPAAAPVAGPVTVEGLYEKLVALGYQPEKIEIPNGGGAVACKLSITHGGMRRDHYFGVDAVSRVVVIVAGTTEFTYDGDTIGADMLRKMAQATHRMGPSYVFLNDNNAVGMATPFGNHEVTNDYLRAQLDRHLGLFDSTFVPLMRDISAEYSALSVAPF